jgi:tetratricopeptide (TPR) repeat protein
MIGRCSTDNTQQIENVVTKIINFKPETMVGNNSMFTVLGDDDNQSLYFQQSCALYQLNTIPFLDSYQNSVMYPDEYYGFLPSGWNHVLPWGISALSTQYAMGQRFMNYMGHGTDVKWHLNTTNGFDYDDLGFEHQDKLPFIFSAACLTGAFQTVDDCMAERFLCEDPDIGAISFVGSSKTSFSTSFKLVPEYYSSVFDNYSYVTGESIMEIKIANWDDAWYTYNGNHNYCREYNLFGDPALNIIYENTDEINPDLVIKKNEIYFSQEQIQFGDIVTIDAVIRNYSWKDAAGFNVNCYAGDPSLPGTILIGSNQIDELNGNEQETTSYTWNTEEFGADIYDIYIVVDPENQITEMNYDNNINYRTKAVYYFHPNFPVSNNMQFNSHVVTFDVNEDYEGKEIMHGTSKFTIDGQLLNPYNTTQTIGNTCIANLSNNTDYQIICAEKTNAKVTSTGIPDWEYSIDGKKYSPLVFDIDSDGYEEVFCLSIDNSNNAKVYCLNYNGDLRWSIDFLSEAPDIFYSDMLVGNFNGEFNSLVFIDKFGKVFNIYESPIGEPQIINYQVLPNCIEIVTSPVASDINKDGIAEIVLVYKGIYHFNEVLMLANIDANEFVINTFIVVDYQNKIINPVISDINNDGQSEIIIGVVKSGIYIYNMELVLQNYIPDNNLINSEIVIGDIYDDGDLDIFCQVKIDNFYGIKAYDIEGNKTFFAPVIGDYESCWLDDLNNDKQLDFIYADKDDLYVVNLLNAGDNIGWPGQRANLRNTGVYEQPAFFGENGETVYWMNTISISADVDNIIPEGSTVVIKPGTKIRAHANSSLIVHGNLIAEGTEKHPITFTADINYAQEGYWQGITVPNHSSISMQYCEIKDAEIGVLFEDYNEVTFNNCLLENNLEGIGVFNSRPVIKENIITANITGIGCYKNAAPVLSDFHYVEPFRNGIINNNTGILLSNSIVYLDNGYNDIYNQFSGGYYINIISEPANYIKATRNFWGTTNLDIIFENLNPSEYFDIEPVLPFSQSSYEFSGSDETEMLQSATNSMESEDYPAAEYTYKTIIQQYPETQEAYVSVSGLYDCIRKSNGNMQNLETYYTNLYNDSTYSQEFNKLVFGYINLCKREQAKFDEAVANYETIILNDPTYNDSVFAVIDIGNTYEEAGNYKSTLGTLSYLVPLSRAKHVEKQCICFYH